MRVSTPGSCKPLIYLSSYKQDNQLEFGEMEETKFQEEEEEEEEEAVELAQELHNNRRIT